MMFRQFTIIWQNKFPINAQMTFEEFLVKKKIDPLQLKEKGNAFFSEFESYFHQLGEKSFDYSKKFWFNKLRRTYTLREEPKPLPVQEENKNNEVSAPENELTKQEKTAYVPRLKSAVTSTNNQDSAKTETASASKYKPRYKAVPIASDKLEETNPGQSPESKPVFKPRFKPGITKSANE